MHLILLCNLSSAQKVSLIISHLAEPKELREVLGAACICSQIVDADKNINFTETKLNMFCYLQRV